MADLRIVDAPVLPQESITDDVKMPTGGLGNYAIRLGDLVWYVVQKEQLASKNYVDTSSKGVKDSLDVHIADKNNPHQVTKEQVGLGNVDNTADIDKPVSNSTKSAIITATNDMATKTYVNTKTIDVYNTILGGVEASSDTLKKIADKVVALAQTDEGLVSANKTQTFTNSQKTQARNNIDAVGKSDNISDLLVTTENGLTQREINNMTVYTVATTNDLLTVANPKDKQVVYVKSTQCNYIYNPASTLAAIKNVVVGKWEMELQEQYLASWVATPDVQESQAMALQALYKYATDKGKPFTIDKVFWVTGQEQNTDVGWLGSIIVLNNSEIRFINDGALRILPTNIRWYSAISTNPTTINYKILNPKIIGDRPNHIYDEAGMTHEWGECITIHGSRNGYIFRPTLIDSIGDGLYIGMPYNYEGGLRPTDITVIEPRIDACRRNGLVLACGINVTIERPIITRIGVTTDGIAGTAPGGGIDFECEQTYENPNATIAYLQNCYVTSPSITNTIVAFGVFNKNNGIEISVNVTGTTYIENPNGSVLGVCQYGAYCTGAIEFDHVLVKDFKSEVDQPIAWCGTGQSKFIIKKLTFEKSKDFILRYDPMFQMNGKVLGNVFFDEIILENANVVLMSRDTNLDTYTDNSVFKKSEYANCNMLFNRHSNIPNLGKKFLLDGVATLDAGTINQTNIHPNTMLLDPSKDLSSVMYVTLSENDFRKLKFLAPTGGSYMGAGVEIRGLYIPNNGDVKTSIKTISTDAWIVLQKQDDGTTKIIDSYGTWTFA